MADFATIEELQASIKANLKQELLAELRVELAHMFEGVRAVLEQGQSRHTQSIEQLSQAHVGALAEVRAAIPQMPDMGPMVVVLDKLAEVSSSMHGACQALSTQPDPSVTALTQIVRDLLVRMDKPVIREGTAELPSGSVKLRIVETKGK